MNASGKCLCGQVTFQATDVESKVHACHCGMCRSWSGGPSLSVMVGGIEFDGETHIGRYDSSEWAQRGFCKDCGTNLFYYLKPHDQYVVWMGSFDDAKPFKLASEIYIDEKPAGYNLAGEHPRLTGEEFLASMEQGE